MKTPTLPDRSETVAASERRIKLTPDLMEEAHQSAVIEAAERLLTEPGLLRKIWPGAYDARTRNGTKLDLGDVELVVMHLDRIGVRAERRSSLPILPTARPPAARVNFWRHRHW